MTPGWSSILGQRVPPAHGCLRGAGGLYKSAQTRARAINYDGKDLLSCACQPDRASHAHTQAHSLLTGSCSHAAYRHFHPRSACQGREARHRCCPRTMVPLVDRTASHWAAPRKRQAARSQQPPCAAEWCSRVLGFTRRPNVLPWGQVPHPRPQSAQLTSWQSVNWSSARASQLCTASPASPPLALPFAMR